METFAIALDRLFMATVITSPSVFLLVNNFLYSNERLPKGCRWAHLSYPTQTLKTTPGESNGPRDHFVGLFAFAQAWGPQVQTTIPDLPFHRGFLLFRKKDHRGTRWQATWRKGACRKRSDQGCNPEIERLQDPSGVEQRNQQQSGRGCRADYPIG